MHLLSRFSFVLVIQVLVIISCSCGVLRAWVNGKSIRWQYSRNILHSLLLTLHFLPAVFCLRGYPTLQAVSMLSRSSSALCRSQSKIPLGESQKSLEIYNKFGAKSRRHFSGSRREVECDRCCRHTAVQQVIRCEQRRVGILA